MTRSIGQMVFRLVLMLCLAAQGVAMASAGPVGATVSAVICINGEERQVTIDLSTGAPVETEDCCSGCWHCPAGKALTTNPLVAGAGTHADLLHRVLPRGDAAVVPDRGLPPPARGPPMV